MKKRLFDYIKQFENSNIYKNRKNYIGLKRAVIQIIIGVSTFIGSLKLVIKMFK